MSNPDNWFRRGKVVTVDEISKVCTLDVGATDAQGNTILMEDVKFVPEFTPKVGDEVRMAYETSSVHSIYIAGLAF